MMYYQAIVSIYILVCIIVVIVAFFHRSNP